MTLGGEMEDEIQHEHKNECSWKEGKERKRSVVWGRKGRRPKSGEAGHRSGQQRDSECSERSDNGAGLGLRNEFEGITPQME